jgi:hypothetical protein
LIVRVGHPCGLVVDGVEPLDHMPKQRRLTHSPSSIDNDQCRLRTGQNTAEGGDLSLAPHEGWTIGHGSKLSI